MKDQFSQMDERELIKIIKKLTQDGINNGHGLPIVQDGWSAHCNFNDKQMRQFIRFCYRNLKPEYIAKVEVLDKL